MKFAGKCLFFFDVDHSEIAIARCILFLDSN